MANKSQKELLTNLADSIQRNTSQPVDRQSLIDIREEQIANNESNEDKTSELIDALGGIDFVLDEILKNENIELSNDKLQTIHNLISPSSSTSINNTKPANNGMFVPSKIKQQPTTTTAVAVDMGNSGVLSGKSMTALNVSGGGRNKHKNQKSSLTSGVLAGKSMTALNAGLDMGGMERDSSASVSGRGAFCFEFEQNNSYLDRYFSHKNKEKILKVLHSHYSEALMTITMTFYLIMLIFYLHSFWFGVYMIVCATFVWLPFEITWLLSLNIDGRKIVTKSFEFWFKVAYAFAYGIYDCIINFGYKADTFESPWVSFFGRFLMIFVIGNSVAIVGSFDAVRMNKIWKIVVSTLCAFIALAITVKQQLTAYQDGDIYLNITDTIGFSLSSSIISVTRVLSIFLAKQAYFTWKRTERSQTKLDKCVSMKYTPYILNENIMSL